MRVIWKSVRAWQVYNNLVYRMQARVEPTQVEKLSGAPFLGRLLPLPKNVRPHLRDFSGESTVVCQAYS
jgi:hypothetical protein